MEIVESKHSKYRTLLGTEATEAWWWCTLSYLILHVPIMTVI